MNSCYLCGENKRCTFYYGLSSTVGSKYREEEIVFLSRFIARNCGFYNRKGWRIRPDLFVKKKGYWFYNFVHYTTYYIIGLCEWLQRKTYKFHRKN